MAKELVDRFVTCEQFIDQVDKLRDMALALHNYGLPVDWAHAPASLRADSKWVNYVFEIVWAARLNVVKELELRGLERPGDRGDDGMTILQKLLLDLQDATASLGNLKTEAEHEEKEKAIAAGQHA